MIRISNEKLSNYRKKLYDTLKHQYSGTDITKLTLGGVLKLFRITKLYDSVEIQLNRPLTVTKRIPWNMIRELRNEVIHENKNVSREKALEILQYVKYFLLETLLSPSIQIVVNDTCEKCHISISKDWEYCPNCALKLKIFCKNEKCSFPMRYDWVTCPKCNTPADLGSITNALNIYSYYCKAVWSDGYLNSFERVFLINKRRELGLYKSDALKIEEDIAPENAVKFKILVEAALIDKKITDDDREFLKNKAMELRLLSKLANSIFLAITDDINNKPLFDSNELEFYSRPSHSDISRKSSVYKLNTLTAL